MALNTNAKLIPLVVFVLGLVAAVGMYLRTEKGGQTSGIAAVVSTATQVPASISPSPSPTPDFSTWQGALNAAYGGDMGHWHPVPAMDEWRSWNTGTSLPLLSTAVTDSTSTIEDGYTRVYVALETVPVPDFGCRACDAVLGGAVIRGKDGSWVVEDLQTIIVFGGTMGQLYESPTLIQIGQDRIAIKYYDEIDAQGGVRWGWTTLYAYLDGEFRNVFEMKNAMETTMWVCPAAPAYGFDTKIEILPSSKGSYELQAIRRRTDIDANGRITKQATTASRYSFNGSHYVLTSDWKPYIGPEKIEPYPALGPNRCLG